MKKVFITGIGGQDGSYLSELLLEKGYEVHGLVRRSSTNNLGNISHLLEDIHIHYGDMTDSTNLFNLINTIRPDEIYNLAAMSQVGVSFVSPEHTEDTNAIGPLRILEAIKMFCPSCRFYQASTSELFGHCADDFLNEDSKFHPVSPYAIAKLNALWYVRYFKEAYGIFACNGILFNHESPRRGNDFVTKKIVKHVSEIVYGKRDKLFLGNLDSLRDWGFAGDYVKAMWLMLQQDKPQDYVIATGESHSVKEFCELVFKYFDIDLLWEGIGVDMKAINPATGDIVIEVNPEFYRPLDVFKLKGDSSRARNDLKWEPLVSFKELVEMMIKNEIKNIGDKK